MAKFCTECGAAMENDRPTCPNCGKAAEGYAPQRFINEPLKEEPVSLGDWIVTMILTGIPVVGFIMLIIWALSAEKRSKKNYARATLIFMVIAVVFTVLLVGCAAVVAEM